MAGLTSKETVSSETKKKLKTPTPFSGKCKDLRKFLQEVKIYLWENRSLYLNDEDKILFVISYMSDGDANAWKEEYFEAAKQAAAQTNSPDPTLGTYEQFIKKLTDNVSPYDALKDAIHDMKEMQMNNTPIEEHIANSKCSSQNQNLTRTMWLSNTSVKLFHSLTEEDYGPPHTAHQSRRMVYMGHTMRTLPCPIDSS